MPSDSKADFVLNCVGKTAFDSVLRLAKVTHKLGFDGDVVTVVGDAPGLLEALRNWCEAALIQLREVTQVNGNTVAQIVLTAAGGQRARLA